MADDGTGFEIAVSQYQFPDIVSGGSRDWDANWLVVAGTLRFADGTTQNFEGPILTTWEAAELEDWLGDIAAAALGKADEREVDFSLDFTERDLAFKAEFASGKQVTVRVGLLRASGRPEREQLRMVLTADQLRAAARRWHDDTTAFPPR